MVKGRQCAYCFVWLLFTTGTDVLFLATSCLLYSDTVPLIFCFSGFPHNKVGSVSRLVKDNKSINLIPVIKHDCVPM